MPDELGNICDLARQHCRNPCLPRQTHSAMPHKRTGTLPPSVPVVKMLSMRCECHYIHPELQPSRIAQPESDQNCSTDRA